MDTTKASKFLSLILRHDPAAAGITLDPQGWADIEALLNGMSKKGYAISHNDLFTIVEDDKKGRYSISDNHRRIRANQGHSIKVDLGLIEKKPPSILYHGTATRFYDAILKSGGVSKMERHHVHLSTNYNTAKTVGSRHGSPLVFSIRAGDMVKEGHKFYESENGVWLTDFVPMKFCYVVGDGILEQ